MVDNTEFPFADFSSLAEQQLPHFLPATDGAVMQLHRAMEYATCNGGKRLRPALVYASGTSLGASLDILHNPACAIEFIHCYSLVHDDLPAMDDSDLRRGKASCHRKFDEATAILTGDALLTLAVQVLARYPAMAAHPERHASMLRILTTAAADMVHGQAMDMTIMCRKLEFAELQNIYKNKTGALISAAVKLGATAAIGEVPEKLLLYADNIGLAFQIRDDILDATADTATLGKPEGSDERHQKNTAVSCLGIAEATKLGNELAAAAVAALTDMGSGADKLRAIAKFSVAREY